MENLLQAILLPLAGEIARGVLAELGEDEVRAVFLAGSIAEGRVAAVEVSGCWEVYSDLDLYVLLASSQRLRQARARARQLGRRWPRQGRGYRFFKEPDIGVYDWNDLAQQRDRPGVVAALRHYMVLCGEGGILAQLAGGELGKVKKEEGLRLLENRLLERAALLEDPAGREDAGWERYRRYQILKAAGDAASALLIYSGRFCIDPHERRKALEALSIEEIPGGTALAGEGRGLMLWALEAVETLPEVVLRPRSWWEEKSAELEALLLRTWQAIASALLGRDSWEGLLRRRAGAPLTNNFRETRILIARQGNGITDAIKVWSRQPRLSPLGALRLHGLLWFLHKLGHLEGRTSVERYLGHLAAAFGGSRSDGEGVDWKLVREILEG